MASLSIELALGLGRFPGRDDADDRVRSAIAMTDDEQICLVAETEDDEPLFCLGMVRVVDHQSFVVIKYRFGFFKRYVMFVLVDVVLVFIPLELNDFHNYIIIMTHSKVKNTKQKSREFS